MIPQRDLSLLSNRLAGRGVRRIPEAVLERDYCLSWILVGLCQPPSGIAWLTLPNLLDPIARKLEFRGLTLPQVDAEFRAKETRLRRLWQTRLALQMVELPEFDGVYRAVRRSLRQAGIPRR